MIISAFPATGKTFYQKNSKLNVLDSDSSSFLWIKPKVRNPDFPDNYIEHIQENKKKYDVILVSTHQEVRDALKKNGIAFTLVFPDIELKSEYLKRMKKRGSDEAFIKNMKSKWDEYILSLEKEDVGTIILNQGDFLSDIAP